MIKFRKLSPESKDRIKRVAEKTVAGASLGLGISNFMLNQKRAKQDREFHDSQTKATERLTKALEEDLKSHEIDNAARNLHRKTKNKPYKEYVVGDMASKFRKKKYDHD